MGTSILLHLQAVLDSRVCYNNYMDGYYGMYVITLTGLDWQFWTVGCVIIIIWMNIIILVCY